MLWVGVSAANAQQLCGVAVVELVRSMRSPQPFEYVQRVGVVAMVIVSSYVEKRWHVMVRGRQQV